METIDMTGLQGGGATRKTGSCCDLLKRHSGLAAKSVETESKRDFMPLPGDSESNNEQFTLLSPTVILNLIQNLLIHQQIPARRPE